MWIVDFNAIGINTKEHARRVLFADPAAYLVAGAFGTNLVDAMADDVHPPTRRKEEKVNETQETIGLPVIDFGIIQQQIRIGSKMCFQVSGR